MKATEKPQFSKKWWDGSRPSEIKANDLDKILPKVERALADQKKKNGDAQSIDACLAALKTVPGAASKTIRLCDKRQHKDVITVLNKFDALVKSEMSRLEGLKRKLGESSSSPEDEDDEANEGQLFEKDYLYKMMKLMKSAGKELRFGFGLNTNTPESSILLLKRKGKPELLFKTLKKTKQFSNRLLTYGYAKPDPEEGQTLIFRLEAGANEPPRILKLGRKYLRSDKKLRFRKLKLILPSGKTLEDHEADTGDVEGDAATTAAPDMPDLRKEFKQARKEWVAVRDQAIQDLEAVKDAIRDHYLDDQDQFPVVMEKLGELDEIMDNLNDDLRDTLDAYISTSRKQASRLTELGGQAKQLLADYVRYVNTSPLLAAIDQKEFADVTLKAPIERALKKLARTIRQLQHTT